MIASHTAEPGVTARTYVHLLRAARELFQGEMFDRLVPRSHGASALLRNTEAEIAMLDPIAATEAIGLDFVRRGGKYSRPFMTLATYDALTGDNGTLLNGFESIAQFPAAVFRGAMSIELFHKASLVHDDIEDDDGFRYGEPTVHRSYGLSTAINVGDYLIGLGYRLVSRDAAALGADVAADILDSLAGAHIRLAEGQGAELMWRDASDKRLTPLDALNVYALKTAPAFEAALFTGARLAGDVNQLAEPLRIFARNIGIAFQILNDLNDWQGDEHNKLEAGGDVLGGRPTLLWSLALTNLDTVDQRCLLDLVATENDLAPSQRIEQVEQLYRKADVFEQSQQLIRQHEQRALAAVAAIQSEPLRRLLVYLIETVLERNATSSPTMAQVTPGEEHD
jgi:geranylgeranyl diphosphate synthase, type II